MELERDVLEEEEEDKVEDEEADEEEEEDKVEDEEADEEEEEEAVSLVVSEPAAEVD